MRVRFRLPFLALLMSAAPSFADGAADSVVPFVEIRGRGRVTADRPPPYRPGEKVRLTFTPSTGARTAAKPDAPPAMDPADPWAGWVFSHWSWSADHAPGGQPLLQNPVEVTVPEDGRKLYATFLPLGTLAHLTSEQELQLRAISQRRFAGWTEPSALQIRELERKAEHYLEEYRRYHEKWGQVASVIYHDFDRRKEATLEYLGEGATWTGLHLAALALKYRALGGDATTVADIGRALDAFDILTQITGTPGRIARFAGPPEDPAYHVYWSNYRLGAHRGAPPWEHLTWLAWPSRDTYVGSFAGFAALLAHVDDPAVRARVVTLVTRVVDRLLADNWVILDGKGNETPNNEPLVAVIKRTALTADPEKYQSFADDVARYRLPHGGTRDLDHDTYWVNNLEWSRRLALLPLTPPGPQRDQFVRVIREDYAKVRAHMNVGWAAVAWLTAGGLEEADRVTLVGGLLDYPDPPKWKYRVDLALDPVNFPPRRGLLGEDEKHRKYAALPSERIPQDFNWQRSGSQRKGGDFDVPYLHSGFDFYLAYWAGRVAGVVPAPIR